MRKRRILSLLLATMLIVAMFAGCGTPATQTPAATTAAAAATTAAAEQKETTAAAAGSSDKVLIGFSMPTFDDKWLSYMLDAARAQAEKYPDAEFIFTDAKNDSAKQMGQLENFVAQGVKAIVVCPVDTDATEPYTALANENKIPIISVNRVFKNQDQATSYVGSDSIKAGIMQMEYIGEKLGGKGKIVILRGEDSNEAARLRTEGVKQVIKEKYPDIEVVAEQTGKWQRPLGMQIMENWIQSGMEINAVCANNDEMAIGAIMALKDANMLDKVIVGGVDATPDALEYMKNGELGVTVFQNAQGQGAGAVDAGYKAAKGESLDKEIWIPYELVKPEQVDDYIAKWK